MVAQEAQEAEAGGSLLQTQPQQLTEAPKQLIKTLSHTVKRVGKVVKHRWVQYLLKTNQPTCGVTLQLKISSTWIKIDYLP